MRLIVVRFNMLPDCKPGVLQQADGSCTCVYVPGNSSVLVSVYGPCGVRANKEQHDKAVLDVTVQYAISRQDNHMALIKRIITCVCGNSIKLDKHPHTAISIAVFVNKEDEHLLSCILTACCVALLDAGVSMTNTFAAVDIDPHSLTGQRSEGDVLLVLDCTSKNLIFSHCTITLTGSQFLQGLVMAQNKLLELNEMYRTVMATKLSCLLNSQ